MRGGAKRGGEDELNYIIKKEKLTTIAQLSTCREDACIFTCISKGYIRKVYLKLFNLRIREKF